MVQCIIFDLSEVLIAGLVGIETECLFIDDNRENVIVAESVGIASIRFVSAEQLAAELKGKIALTARENR